MDLKKYIRSIPDYPKKGILFRDITTLIKDPVAFIFTNDKIVEIGRDSVNEYNIYIKFGCNENIPNETPTSHIIIKQKI